MILVIREKATKEEIQKMAQDFDGYIKLVVDLEKEILGRIELKKVTLK